VRVRDDPESLTIQDSPGLHWLSGALFIGVGTLFVLGPLGLFTDAATLSWPARLLAASLGAVGVLTGVWVIHRSPLSSLTIDRYGHVRLVRRGARGREVSEWPRGEVAAVHVAEGMDSEGSPVFQLRLTLRGGAIVSVSRLWVHGREPVERAAELVRRALKLPSAASA
jgi:hypothetical protein